VEVERAGLAYLGQLLTENRHGLVERAAATRAVGQAEWQTGFAMVAAAARRRWVTLPNLKHNY
jgi:hypothetical protein